MAGEPLSEEPEEGQSGGEAGWSAAEPWLSCSLLKEKAGIGAMLLKPRAAKPKTRGPHSEGKPSAGRRPEGRLVLSTAAAP